MKKVKDIEVFKDAVNAFKDKYGDEYYLAGVCNYPKAVVMRKYDSYDEYQAHISTGLFAPVFDYFVYLKGTKELVSCTIGDAIWNEYIEDDFKNRNFIYYSLEELGI